MNRHEALAVLARALAEYRSLSYAELRSRIGDSAGSEEVGPSGTEYQIEVQAFWDAEPEGNIRVQGSISAGLWRQFVPLGDDFIMAPDGTLLD